jgi:hypothetical protein
VTGFAIVGFVRVLSVWTSTFWSFNSSLDTNVTVINSAGTDSTLRSARFTSSVSTSDFVFNSDGTVSTLNAITTIGINVMTTLIIVTLWTVTFWRVSSEGVDGTFVTVVENVGTFGTSDVTDFTEKSVLDDGFEMVSNTWTFWSIFSVSSTDGTVTIVITFFTSIWTWWTDSFVGVISIDWTVTGRSVNSVSGTNFTIRRVRVTGLTHVITRFTFVVFTFIESSSTFTSWSVNSVNTTRDTLAWSGSFTGVTVVTAISFDFNIESDGSD